MSLELNEKHIAVLRAHASNHGAHGTSQELIPDYADFARLSAELDAHKLLSWVRTYEGEARQKNRGPNSRVFIETQLITEEGRKFLAEYDDGVDT